ncbi:beta transducin-like protein het-e4s [Colletotrichum chrysophilum]|uniref:Beta transducin-like protein het-e4s n=1 Tax=Colletotrichum chrysophilum TaxID=1836956 RepID=A0AAD9EEN2_9PEZI|nr:beta transducin-like protein het-e4s [Colletotrichum chrysophilum]
MATNSRNSGSGSQYSNTHGTQNNNSGSGNQFNANTINYNAQNQSDSKLLTDLRVTDPRDDKRRIERRKGGLLRDSYYKILDHEAFVRWMTDTRSSLLWIKRRPW